MNLNDIRQHLFASLHQRVRPEDVADGVLALLRDRLAPAELRLLEQAAQGALTRGSFGYSSMAATFRAVVGFDRQFAKARELFAAALPETAGDAQAQLDRLPTIVTGVAREIGAAAGHLDFRGDRLNRATRELHGLDLSRRRYNKLFRFVARLEAKAGRVGRELRVRQLTMIGKSRLAAQVEWDEFSANDHSASFIAYFTARSNLRSEFTIVGQQRAYDEIAHMLFERCVADPDSRWAAVGQVYSPPHVIRRLSETEKGALLARWFAVLEQTASLLRETWERNTFKRATMIVARGNDSSTWNQLAGAWNKARDAWFGLLEDMGCTEGLARFCPGKVMRLMAADVAAWHGATGGGLDPQTAVWCDLPLPWEMLSGESECSQAHVEAVCLRHGVDPTASGWTHARRGGSVAEFRPTPELVHGVSVGHPGLALLFRRWGVFSGKPVTQPFTE